MVAPFRHINREELYELVWQKTMREVGEDLGIEASRIGPMCRRLRVPTPPLGYWMKRVRGKPVPDAPPLTTIQRGELRSLQIHRTDGRGWTDDELRERKAMLDERDRARAAAIEAAALSARRRAVLADLSRRSDEAERLQRFLGRLETMLPDLSDQPAPEWLTWICEEIERLDPFAGDVDAIVEAIAKPKML